MLHYVYCNNAVQQSKVNAMQKLTKAHSRNIQLLTLGVLQKYIALYVQICANEGLRDVTMLAADVLRIASAVHAFSVGGNVQQLHTAIMLQDTLVREKYISVLRYIEDNNLVAVKVL
jgi:hypothetical protein